MNKYSIIPKEGTKEGELGHGTYGTVFKAKRIIDNKLVAMKRFHLPNQREIDGIDLSTIREIVALENLKHENIVTALDIFFYNKELYLILELMQGSLQDLIDAKVVFTEDSIKTYMLMAIRGLNYLHQNFIVHRDISPGNLLISSSGVLKISVSFWPETEVGLSFGSIHSDRRRCLYDLSFLFLEL